MKNRFNRIWVLFPLLLLLASCGGAIESMTFKSPNGDRSIDVTGKRESPAGPIVVTVTLHVPKGDKGFTFEHQASALTKDNCTAEWLNNEHCNLNFKLDDGTSWQVECYLLDDRVEAIKNFQIDGKSIFH